VLKFKTYSFVCLLTPYEDLVYLTCQEQTSSDYDESLNHSSRRKNLTSCLEIEYSSLRKCVCNTWHASYPSVAWWVMKRNTLTILYYVTLMSLKYKIRKGRAILALASLFTPAPLCTRCLAVKHKIPETTLSFHGYSGSLRNVFGSIRIASSTLL